MKRITRPLLTILSLAAFITLLGLAGRSDYEDALIVEMKDNGAYPRLARQYPGATDHRLATIYEAQRDSLRAAQALQASQPDPDTCNE